MKNTNRRKYINLILFFMTSVIILLLSYIFWVTWNDYYRKGVVNPFYEKGALLLVLVYIIIYSLFSKIYGGHKIGYLKVPDIMFSQSLSVTFCNIVIYMQISLIAKKLVDPLALVVMTIIDIIVVILWVFICNKLYYKIYPPIQILLVYSNENAISLMLKLGNHKDKYKVSDVIDIAKGIDIVQKEIDKYEAVLICDLDSTQRNKIVKYCFKKSIRIYITPKISDIFIQSADNLHIFDTPLLLCRNQGLTYEQSILKRLMDTAISLIAIIILSPFMILVAISIKLYDGGSIFYKQNRLTMNDKVFEIYKFRSMLVNAESDGKARLATQNDDRITPVGKVIRKIRFDELPQLFNILKGDMSLVGPRPERPEISEQYSKIMPEFGFRTKVKAGLTGYAQVMGKYNTTPYDKLKLDLMYIGNYSFFMDMELLLKTIKILFMSESTEGVDEGDILPELAIFEDTK